MLWDVFPPRLTESLASPTLFTFQTPVSAQYTVAAQYKHAVCITDSRQGPPTALYAGRLDYCPMFTLCAGVVPSVGKDRYPPSLHLAEASIRELDVQR